MCSNVFHNFIDLFIYSNYVFIKRCVCNCYRSEEEDEARTIARERTHHRKSRDRQEQDSRRKADTLSTDNKDKVNDRKHDRHSRDNFNDRKQLATDKSSKSSYSRLEGVEKDSKAVDKESRVKEKNECNTAKRRSNDERLDEKRVKTVTDETLNAKPIIIVKRTTETSLEDARARYLARKAAMKVPVLKEDSD